MKRVKYIHITIGSIKMLYPVSVSADGDYAWINTPNYRIALHLKRGDAVITPKKAYPLDGLLGLDGRCSIYMSTFKREEDTIYFDLTDLKKQGLI